MKIADAMTLGLSSAAGLGYVPVAPGTFGTLAALPLWWGLRRLSPGWFALAAVGFALAAVGVSARAEKFYGAHDVGKIVIDEVAGLLFAAIAVPFRWQQVVAAFAVFRLLDAAKPFPICWFDRTVGGGVGVVIDDVVAGLITCALLHGARMLMGGWW